jgi:hypothetical protein
MEMLPQVPIRSLRFRSTRPCTGAVCVLGLAACRKSTSVNR